MSDEAELAAARELISDYPEDAARTIATLTRERDEARAEVARLRDIAEHYDPCATIVVQRLIRERDEARALLREFQWGGYLKVCLSCGRSPEEGHNAICRIAAALEGP